ncbi:four helix bundle protein [Nostoc sp. TCL26-01]|uniref:four helix bundle protein n=1 Tax=Nostoc sp. TCL26-01 TaxID=2576904 RepID=UPI001C4C2FEF|nr:four helix bundle protein [Nostoc sp. TCL26-01]
MDKEQFKERTQSFALQIINLVEALPKEPTTSQIIGKQLLRSGMSVGANYRAAFRAKSTAELITKHNITLEEAINRCTGWN